MTTDPLSRLAAPARDFIEVIGEGADRGETKDQIQARIRAINKEAGIINRKTGDGRGIRDIYLGQALKFLRGEKIEPPDQRFTNLEKSPDPTRAASSKGPILRRFSYNVGIIDKKTGELIKGGVTVSSDTRRSIADIKAQAEASVAANGIEAYLDEDGVPDDFELVVLSSLEASETIL